MRLITTIHNTDVCIEKVNSQQYRVTVTFPIFDETSWADFETQGDAWNWAWSMSI